MIEVNETKSGNDETTARPPIELLILQPDFTADGREHYHVSELLQYHDRHFIENVYRAILGRIPFVAERERELEDLRGGRLDKFEIIERVLSSADAARGARDAGRRVRIEGLPSPLMRRLHRAPVLGYLLRLVRAVLRLPVWMRRQQQFETYALAQQQLIADYINQFLTNALQTYDGEQNAASSRSGLLSVLNDTVESVTMLSEALADISSALTEQQQLTEAMRREQQLTADAQQEFLTQEQRVIVETQKAVLEELREQVRELAEREQQTRTALFAEVRRWQAPPDEARRNLSDQA